MSNVQRQSGDDFLTGFTESCQNQFQSGNDRSVPSPPDY